MNNRIMNNRIKELYDQANIRYSVYEILKPRDERKNIPDIFAELIVRECRDIVAKTRDQAIEAGWYVDEAMSTAMYDIEEHFGVWDEKN